jgi:fructose-1,6-bisphosphatase/inositol monophosphatase family enzyme
MVHEELEEVKRIARQAGVILLKYFRGSPAVEWKAPGDPMTVADREAVKSVVILGTHTETSFGVRPH